MAKDYIGYQGLLDAALRGVVRDALLRIEKQGLIGSHHFYITFKTGYPGVDIPSFLVEQYPDEMTIILQHQFWGLKIREDDFEVALTFRKLPATLVIPFAALTKFFDPGVPFGLEFKSVEDPDAKPLPKPVPKPQIPRPSKVKSAPKPREQAPRREPVPIEVPAHADAPLSTSRPCTLMELTSTSCRFPIGDPCHPEFRFCGARKEIEDSYCSTHHAMSRTSAQKFTPRQPSARTAPHPPGASRIFESEDTA